MTFKHKLSRRLALLMDLVLVVTLAAAAACERIQGATDPTVPGPVTQLKIVPDSVSVSSNQVVQFMAVGLTANSDTGSVAVSWSVTGGTVIDTSTSGGHHYGRYKSGTQPGKYKVVATGNPGGVADTAAVTIVTVPVASVSVSPASDSVQQGATVQLTPTTKDSAGNVLTSRLVTWSSSAPTVATVNN